MIFSKGSLFQSNVLFICGKINFFLPLNGCAFKRNRNKNKISLHIYTSDFICEFFFSLDTHKIVSEAELHQLAQIRPLIFNFHEQTAIKDCLKMLEKKTGAYDIMQEFMVNIFLTKVYM